MQISSSFREEDDETEHSMSTKKKRGVRNPRLNLYQPTARNRSPHQSSSRSRDRKQLAGKERSRSKSSSGLRKRARRDGRRGRSRTSKTLNEDLDDYINNRDGNDKHGLVRSPKSVASAPVLTTRIMKQRLESIQQRRRKTTEPRRVKSDSCDLMAAIAMVDVSGNEKANKQKKEPTKSARSLTKKYNSLSIIEDLIINEDTTEGDSAFQVTTPKQQSPRRRAESDEFVVSPVAFSWWNLGKSNDSNDAANMDGHRRSNSPRGGRSKSKTVRSISRSKSPIRQTRRSISRSKSPIRQTRRSISRSKSPTRDRSNSRTYESRTSIQKHLQRHSTKSNQKINTESESRGSTLTTEVMTDASSSCELAATNPTRSSKSLRKKKAKSSSSSTKNKQKRKSSISKYLDRNTNSTAGSRFDDVRSTSTGTTGRSSGFDDVRSTSTGTTSRSSGTKKKKKKDGTSIKDHLKKNHDGDRVNTFDRGDHRSVDTGSNSKQSAFSRDSGSNAYSPGKISELKQRAKSASKYVLSRRMSIKAGSLAKSGRKPLEPSADADDHSIGSELFGSQFNPDDNLKDDRKESFNQSTFQVVGHQSIGTIGTYPFAKEAEGESAKAGKTLDESHHGKPKHVRKNKLKPIPHEAATGDKKHHLHGGDSGFSTTFRKPAGRRSTQGHLGMKKDTKTKKDRRSFILASMDSQDT